MAWTLTYKINRLKVKDQVNADGETLRNAVVQTYWTVTGTDEQGHTAEFAGATPFTAENVPAGSFTAFESLTEETVLGWVTNVVNTSRGYLDHITMQLDREVAELIEEEVMENQLPWAPDPGDPADDPDGVA